MSDPTRLVARVRSPEEAAVAMAAGTDGALLTRPGATPVLRGLAAETAVFNAGPLPDAGALAAMRARGIGCLLVDTFPARLVDTHPFPELATLAADARAAGLSIAFSGAIEAPDVPRLLPLEPAFLVFDEEVLNDVGAFDAKRIAALRSTLLPQAATLPAGPRDLVFVRDLLLSMELGAYRSERGRAQRVRVSMTAEVAPAGAAKDIADVYSYDRMIDAAHAMAARPPEPFVEVLAETLAAEILRDPRVLAVTVRIEKLDLGPGAAGVEIRRTAPGTRLPPASSN